MEISHPFNLNSSTESLFRNHRSFIISSFQLKQHVAAVEIQRIWRGYRVRRRICKSLMSLLSREEAAKKRLEAKYSTFSMSFSRELIVSHISLPDPVMRYFWNLEKHNCFVFKIEKLGHSKKLAPLPPWTETLSFPFLLFIISFEQFKSVTKVTVIANAMVTMVLSPV